MRTGAIVIIMQRLHSEDLSGFILANNNYDHLNLPMRYEPENKAHTSIGFEDPRTEPGELLWPDRFTEPIVEELEHSMGSYSAAGQLQQRPVPREGGMFKTEDFRMLDHLPMEPVEIIRAYDKAGTEGGGKRTAGVKIAKLPENQDGIRYVIMDVVKGQWSVGKREEIIKQTAINDGHRTRIVIEQEPGSGGKESAMSTVQNLEGFTVTKHKPSGDKTVRAEPLATQAEIGAVGVLKRDWTDSFIDELGMFPGGKFSDQVDAASMAANELMKRSAFQEETDIQPAIQVVT